MNIVACTTGHGAAWDAYAAAAPDASFYHRFAWKRINERAFGHETAFLAAFEEERIAGILPLVRVSSWLFGTIACSMPFVNYGGPVADTPAIEQALLAEARRVCDTWAVEYCELRTRHYLGDDLPCSRHKVSLTLRLDRDPDVHWNAFKTGHRQDIRRASKNGLVARFGGVELLDPFLEVMSESWRDLGTPLYSRHFFKVLFDMLGEHIRLCVVFAGREPAAAAFDGLHGGTVEGLWMGSKARFRRQLAAYLLYWELIKNAAEGGYTRFHLGRSTADSGGEAFKKKWNAELEPLFWHYILRTRTEIPSLNVGNPRYQMAINAWRRLPVPITRLIGPSIARGIP